jgi:hypothetical protein
MGSGTQRYHLTWNHERLSDTYGLLQLRSAERYTSPESDDTTAEDIDVLVSEPDFDDLERAFYRDITYEYIRLPKNEFWIADDPSLESMRALGLAAWHPTFDVVLLLHFSVAMIRGKFKETELGLALTCLDKMKFMKVSEANMKLTGAWPPAG